jgi:hypothetical protein
MRPSTVSSLSEDFRTRRQVSLPEPVAPRDRRIGIVSSVAIIMLAVWIGWIVGSGRAPLLIQTVKALLPIG